MSLPPMEAATTYRCSRCTTGTIRHAWSINKKPGVVHMYDNISKPLFTPGLTVGGRLIFSQVGTKKLLSYAKASETTLAGISDDVGGRIIFSPAGRKKLLSYTKASKTTSPETSDNGVEFEDSRLDGKYEIVKVMAVVIALWLKLYPKDTDVLKGRLLRENTNLSREVKQRSKAVADLNLKIVEERRKLKNIKFGGFIKFALLLSAVLFKIISKIVISVTMLVLLFKLLLYLC